MQHNESSASGAHHLGPVVNRQGQVQSNTVIEKLEDPNHRVQPVQPGEGHLRGDGLVYEDLGQKQEHQE